MIDEWKNVPCPGCGCVCDDIRVAFDGDTMVRFEPSCDMGRDWFRKHSSADAPQAEVGGCAASVENAVQRSVELLRQANYPLVYGLSRSATSGQRAALELAETLGGVIDTTASLCHGPSIMALQEMGEVTCTLGEIRNRADLVIFWGCQPAVSHPRHAQRYSVFPSGRYIQAGRADRTVIMVGDARDVGNWRLDSAGAAPDLVVPVEPGHDFNTLLMLKRMLRGDPVDDAPAELRTLFDLMCRCRYGVVFFGLGIAETSMWDGQPHEHVGHVNVAALLQLVADMNAKTRFTARRMRMQGDVSGADNVMCWQTGYPFAVDYSRGYPRYNPGEFTADELLSQRDVDLCLLVGAETVQFFSAAAREQLASIPTIVLDYPGAESELKPDVLFTTAVYGLHATGTVYRMDNVPISLKAPLQNEMPTDADILRMIRQAL
ncbi:MAG: formylmethanofuran dehydrogenase subunit B [Planctomycetales bacterium]|nr:formylmethanofuran dehydrogenase subunit B [Planctomycetales bacterium]